MPWHEAQHSGSSPRLLASRRKCGMNEALTPGGRNALLGGASVYKPALPRVTSATHWPDESRIV
jgi:hypothetical protein